MTFWRNIANLAAQGVDEATCADCPPGLPGEDPAFSTAVTALGAKLAKVDGRASAAEFAAFAEVFQPHAASARDIRRLYDLARQTTRGFESYARRLARRYRSCPRLLEDVLDGLFHIACADGALNGEELTYLSRVCDLFGLEPQVFRRIKATYLGPTMDDPYLVIGASHDASNSALRAAWRTALAETHPDRMLARGLPAEFLEVATAKSAAINAAYDVIMRERRAAARNP